MNKLSALLALATGVSLFDGTSNIKRFKPVEPKRKNEYDEQRLAAAEAKRARKRERNKGEQV